MQDFETEEQQLEALKKWWKENSGSLFIGLGVGLAGIAGWQYFTEHQLSHGQSGSDLYTVVHEQVKKGQFTDINKLEELTTDFTDTPYAAMASLSVAKYYFERGKTEEAIKHLSWAEQNARSDETLHVARTRLATVYVDTDRLDEALSLLEQPHPEEFTFRYEELKGDIYAAKGDDEKAREAYDKAMTALGADGTPWLRLKRDNVGS